MRPIRLSDNYLPSLNCVGAVKGGQYFEVVAGSDGRTVKVKQTYAMVVVVVQVHGSFRLYIGCEFYLGRYVRTTQFLY